jgi:MFS family permease
MNKASQTPLGWPVLLFVTANFVSNVGTWLFTLASSWLMTELDGSALMVSLVQSASTIPLFIFALPAGALGDIFDRRRSLLIAQAFLTISTAIFAYVVYCDLATVQLLLFFTFLNGVGAAFSRPVMAAIIPQLVDKVHLRTAVNLGGISFNLSRSVGPVVGGYLITRFNIALPFWVDAATFLAVLIYLFYWRDDRAGIKDGQQPPLILAIGDSWRFFRYTPALRHSILKAATFFFASGALWALLPLVARNQLSGDADLYGYLVGAAGAGAVLAGFGIGRLTSGIGANNVMLVASGIMSVGLCLLGWSTSIPLSLVFSGLCGAAWQSAYTTLMTSAQYALPRWFGARGMAYYIMSISLCLAVGSALWGWIADLSSLSVGYYSAAGTLVVMALLGRSFHLDQAKDVDLDAASESLFDYVEKKDNQTTIFSLLAVKYSIDHKLREELLQRLTSLRGSRYRSGSLQRELYLSEDAGYVKEHVLIIANQNYSRSRFQTTAHDAKMEAQFQSWLKEHGGKVEKEVLYRS